MLPLSISVSVAGALLGLSIPASYNAAANGLLPVANWPGRKRILVRDFVEKFGAVDDERLAAAQARVTRARRGGRHE